MNGDIENDEKENIVDEEVELTETSEDSIVLEDVADIDNVGDISVEINVEELVAKLEASDGDAEDHKKEIHRRLEALNDEREADQALDSTYNFNLDDDL